MSRRLHAPGQLPLANAADLSEATDLPQQGSGVGRFASRSRALSIVCDACGARRAPWRCAQPTGAGCHADSVAGHVAAVIPRVPLRHWQLHVPAVAACLGGGDKPWIAGVVRAFVAALFSVYRATAAPGRSGGRWRCGGVSVVRRRGAMLRSEFSLHVMMLDGVYATGVGAAPPVFVPHRGPPDVDAVSAAIAGRLQDPRLRQQLSVAHAPVAGPAVGAVRRRLVPGCGADRWRGWSSRGPGVCVRAGRVCMAGDRASAIALVAQVTRPVADPRRMSVTREGWVRYRLAFPLSDGTRFVELSPEAVAERLSQYLGGMSRRVRFHGILAGGAGLRDRIMPAQLTLASGPPVVEMPNPAGRRPPHRVRSRSEPQRTTAPGRGRALLNDSK
ncbi:MAG: hypothetical protein JKY37_30600 [Nannocystaceae bacterium]|nr:hypothetical protein [Nannocystaceae bacterium]